MNARTALGIVALLAGAGVARGQAPAPAAAAPAPAASAVAPTTAVLEKLAAGDRAVAAGDLKNALFAYQDAAYAQPEYLTSRVKMGRTYLAMRYPDFAMAQAEIVLKGDPSNPEALALLDDARRAPPRSAAPSAPATAEAPRPGPRTFKIVPEQPPAAAPAAAESAAAPPAAGPATTEAPSAAAPVGSAPLAVAAAPAVVPAPGSAPAAAPAPAPAPKPQTAAQRYRAGVGLIGSRDYAGAVAELSEAIALDPRLAVAYAARASARFGLGKYREAADDYKASMGLDPGLATPLYGLAECYRQLGDPAAVEMYQRYAESKAPDAREDLRAVAAKRAAELSGK
ncbi:MAG: hypothetical protein QM704_16495 [Anaeromyxobacteraceae bacterium]